MEATFESISFLSVKVIKPDKWTIEHYRDITGEVFKVEEIIHGKTLRNGKLYWIDVRVKINGQKTRLFEGEFEWVYPPPVNIYIGKRRNKITKQ